MPAGTAAVDRFEVVGRVGESGPVSAGKSETIMVIWSMLVASASSPSLTW